MWRHNDVNFNVLATELHDLLYNQYIDTMCCYSFFFYPSHESDKGLSALVKIAENVIGMQEVKIYY